MSERKAWEQPLTTAEWVRLAFAVLGAVMLGSCAFVAYTGVTSAFGAPDLLGLLPVVLAVVLFALFSRRRWLFKLFSRNHPDR